MLYFRSGRRSAGSAQPDPLQLAQVQGLQAVMAKMSARDAEFAGSLVSNFYRWGRLSEKQLVWVDTLTQRGVNPAPAPAPILKVNVQRIQAMFDRAGQTLKRVRVKLQSTESQPVVFARAGSASKYAGQILITDGGPFGANRYFGRIDTNGDFHATRQAGADVVALVQEFAAEPEATAGRYGRLTGSCSFCNHSLKDSRSTALGYGPVCAQRFGLVH